MKGAVRIITVINNETKTAEFWLTSVEHQDGAAMEKVRALCADYCKQKYTSAIFVSGKASLLESTSSLIVQNRDLSN